MYNSSCDDPLFTASGSVGLSLLVSESGFWLLLLSDFSIKRILVSNKAVMRDFKFKFSLFNLHNSCLLVIISSLCW